MSKNKLAILYMIISVLCFSFMGAFVKELSYLPVFEKVFFRNLVSLFIAFLLIKSDDKAKILGSLKNQKFLLLRSFLGFLGVVLNFYAFSNLDLADSSILMRLSPFFVAISAFLFLSEKISVKKILTMLIGFTGALIVIRPGLNINIIPALSGLVASIFAGCAYTTVRHLSKLERASTIVFYFSLFSVIVSFPIAFYNFIFPKSIQDWFLLLGIGITAGIAQICLTMAYRFARAAEISIYNYLGIVFSVILGYFFWHEIPDIFTIIGGFIVILSALGNLKIKK